MASGEKDDPRHRRKLLLHALLCTINRHGRTSKPHKLKPRLQRGRLENHSASGKRQQSLRHGIRIRHARRRCRQSHRACPADDLTPGKRDSREQPGRGGRILAQGASTHCLGAGSTTGRRRHPGTTTPGLLHGVVVSPAKYHQCPARETRLSIPANEPRQGIALGGWRTPRARHLRLGKLDRDAMAVVRRSRNRLEGLSRHHVHGGCRRAPQAANPCHPAKPRPRGKFINNLPTASVWRKSIRRSNATSSGAKPTRDGSGATTRPHDERDLEFVVSWLYDLQFATRIATELGLTEDVLSRLAPMPTPRL